MKELLAHLVGDYLLQSHWEASEKTNEFLPGVTHAAKYTLAFVPLTRNPKALAIIGGTHFILDRYRLAKHVNWARNQMVPKKHRFKFDLSNMGSPKEVPQGLAMALMFITDNTMHMLINHYALERYESN